jgi:hypothetical protein
MIGFHMMDFCAREHGVKVTGDSLRGWRAAEQVTLRLERPGDEQVGDGLFADEGEEVHIKVSF